MIKLEHPDAQHLLELLEHVLLRHKILLYDRKVKVNSVTYSTEFVPCRLTEWMTFDQET